MSEHAEQLQEWLEEQRSEWIENARRVFNDSRGERWRDFTESDVIQAAWQTWEVEAWQAQRQKLDDEWPEKAAELRDAYPHRA